MTPMPRRIPLRGDDGFAGCALAQQDYPARPIRYILPVRSGQDAGVLPRGWSVKG